VLLTLIPACDRATVIELDLEPATNHDRTTGWVWRPVARVSWVTTATVWPEERARNRSHANAVASSMPWLDAHRPAVALACSCCS
jgi:hypothetical protein